MAKPQLPRLRKDIQLVDANGSPTEVFMRWWEEIVQDIEDDFEAVAALGLSYPSGLTITGHDNGTTASINISAHNRIYGDGVAVAVNSGSVLALAFSTTYYVYYDDATHAGGAVTYGATTTKLSVAQINGRHALGKVLTPADGAGDTAGVNVLPTGLIGL